MSPQNGVAANRRITKRVMLLMLLGGIFTTWLIWIPRSVSIAAPNLTLELVTWNVIGLNASDLNAGPNTFPVGVRVCNTGDSTATNVATNFIWDNPNQFIQLNGLDSLGLPSLAPNACINLTYQVVVTRNASAINTSRGYHIRAIADGLVEIRTSNNREIYVETLSAQNNLAISNFTGPNALQVGNTYTYTLSADLSSTNYGQIEHFVNFPNTVFRVQSIHAKYNHPTASRDTIYADACGWNNVVGSTNYRTCIGPPSSAFPSGVISGTVSVTYTVQILASGSFTLTAGAYGFTNGSFIYNGDFGQDSMHVEANVVAGGVQYLPIIIKQQPTQPTQTPTATGTQSTPTRTITPSATGSITPNPGATKVVTPIEAGVGQNFTFVIRVVNKGTGPATNVKLTDYFSSYSYLDIYDLTTSKGTKNITGRVATVTIGTVDPGEVVTVRIVIRVNSSAPATTSTPCNIAYLTYGTFGSRSSNTQCFRVRGSSSLPPTGELPILPDDPGPDWSIIFLGLFLGLVGLILLRVSITVWKTQQPRARWLLGAGIGITCLGLFSALTACGLFNRESTSQVDTGLTMVPAIETGVQPSATTNPLAELPAYMFATPNPDEPELIETLPSYPIPSPSIPATSGDKEQGPDTSPVVRMVIPSLDLDAKVAYVPYNGQTWQIQGLREEIAWLGDTSWPGLGGNTGFAGHVTVRGLGNGPFRYLGDLVPGDEIRIYTEKNVYTYQVKESRVVDETDMWVTERTDGSQITLITCVDWNATIGIYLKRLVVIAEEVGVSPVAME